MSESLARAIGCRKGTIRELAPVLKNRDRTPKNIIREVAGTPRSIPPTCTH